MTNLDVVQPETFLDHDLAWELAIAQNQTHDAIAEVQDRITRLQEQLPEGWLNSWRERKEVPVINEKIQKQKDRMETITEASDIRLAKIETGIASNRRIIESVKLFFNPDDSGALQKYVRSHSNVAMNSQRGANTRRVSAISSVLNDQEAGSTKFTLFDSSKPQMQIHGLAVADTLRLFGFNGKQFAKNRSVDEASGVVTSTVTIHPLTEGEGDELVPNEGRSITATYTQTQKDVFVDIEVNVEEGAPEVVVPLPARLSEILVRKSLSANGSDWSEVGYNGIGLDGAERAIQMTKEYRALGGQLTDAQEHAYDGLLSYHGYLAEQRTRTARYR